MASNHDNKETFADYFNEFEDIESCKDPDEEEELSKTPDEGEAEADWLHNAGYGFVAAKIQGGTELSDDELEGLTSSLTRPQADAVQRRINTLTATMRKKQKQGKMHVKDIFTQDPDQDSQSPSSPTYQPPSPEMRQIRRQGSGKNRDRSTFLKKGAYSMSGAYTAEVEHHTSNETIHGVKVLSINPRSTQNWRNPVHHLQTIADAELSSEFHLEERDNQIHRTRNPHFVDLPAFRTKHDPLGETKINDLSQNDLARIRSLALIELTALYDMHNLTYIKAKKKKKMKEHGLFGVPIQTLLEQDRKRCPDAKIPLIFQELIRYLETEGLKVEGILRVPGAVSRVKQLRQELEEKFSAGHFSWRDVWPNDVAAIMKQFIRDLPIPLLTHDYINAFPQIKSIPTTLEQLKALNLLMLLLPDSHRETLRVLLQFLRTIVSNSNWNKMGLNNVAMIMAPNLFLGPATRSKSRSREQLELSKAHGTSNIVKMLIHYQDELWTVPPSFIRQLRYQTEAETKKRKIKIRGRKDKTDHNKKSTAPEMDLPEGVIRVQAPHLTKHSARMQLDEMTTAGDIVAKFKRIASSQHDRHERHERHDRYGDGRDRQGRHGYHSQSFRNPDNAQFADNNAYLFEVGGNIGERCLDPHTRMLDLYRVNRNAEWVIKVVHHR